MVALGGNAISQPGQRGTAEEQRANVQTTTRQIATMIRSGMRVIVTHGNGPQVGNLLIQQEEASRLVPPMPLDICGSQSQGQIGYMIQQSLLAQLNDLKPRPRVVTVVTQVQVDAKDPAFGKPSKPVGPFYGEDVARKRMSEKGETWIEDSGRGWRRVVPSPNPKAIVEHETIRALATDGTVVIACGGGGIPVTVGADGTLVGVEAVIDKDLAAECLARDTKADTLLILTDVSKVALGYRTPEQKNIDAMSAAEARIYLSQGHFKAGSMGPKVEACVRFVEHGGHRAIIASLNEANEALLGRAGTAIRA